MKANIPENYHHTEKVRMPGVANLKKENQESLLHENLLEFSILLFKFVSVVHLQNGAKQTTRIQDLSNTHVLVKVTTD